MIANGGKTIAVSKMSPPGRSILRGNTAYFTNINNAKYTTIISSTLKTNHHNEGLNSTNNIAIGSVVKTKYLAPIFIL